MPLYMDRHDLRGVSAEDVAAANQEDLKVQAKHGCRTLTYWFDEKRGTVFCLVDAPSADAVVAVHREAHGSLPVDVIEVDPSDVGAFLGRLGDPEGEEAQPLRDAAFRAMMFTDMVGSTELTVRLGDEVAFDVLEIHHRIIRGAIGAHRGREVDRAGDGFLASFNTAQQAVDCGAAIQQLLALYNETDRDAPIHVRIGIGAGEPVTRGDSLFGAAVNLAARICAHAQADQVLVSGEIRDLCGDEISFTELGSVTFKGFPAPVSVSEIAWRA